LDLSDTPPSSASRVVDRSTVYGSSPCLALTLCRSWAALERFFCSTDGAVGKKSAKPAEARDMMSEMAMSPIPTWDSPPTPSLMMVRQLVNSHVATQILRVRKTMQFVVAVLGGLSKATRYGGGQKSGRDKEREEQVQTKRRR
jgi:hypothetical protein